MERESKFSKNLIKMRENIYGLFTTSLRHKYFNNSPIKISIITIIKELQILSFFFLKEVKKNHE